LPHSAVSNAFVHVRFRLAQKAAGAQLVVAHEGTEGRFDLIGGRPSPWMTVQEKFVRAMMTLSMRLRFVATGSCPARRGATRPPMQQLP